MLPATHQYPAGKGTRNCRKAWNTSPNITTVFGHALQWDHKQWTVFSNVHSGTPSSLISVIQSSMKAVWRQWPVFRKSKEPVGWIRDMAKLTCVFTARLFNGQVAILSLKWNEWQTPDFFLKCHFMQVEQRDCLPIHQLSLITLPCTAGVVSSCLRLKAGLHYGQVGSLPQGSTARGKSGQYFKAMGVSCTECFPE